MPKIHRSREVVLSIAATVAFALITPMVATAEEQVLNAAPAAPVIAPGPSADANHAATAVYEALAYGPSREEPNAAATAVYEALAYGPLWDAANGYRYNLPAADALRAALASGRRAESAHLATVPLPGQEAVHVTPADC